MRTLAQLLDRRAAGQADDPALIFLADSGGEQARLTYARLRDQALNLARHLAAQAAPGARAVLMLPTGPDFAIALFACAYAGLVAVPLMPPRRLANRDSAAHILDDCAPALMLTLSGLSGRAERVRRDGMTWIELDRLDAVGEGILPPPPSPNDLAVLQYTSGSTSQPRGVMVAHGNFLTNLDAIRVALGNSASSTFVSWGPLYHDMGLVMGLLQPLYLGAPGVLMNPAAFVQRPHLWLRAISHYRAEVAGAPNFAFDLCVNRVRPEQMEGVDLSGWKVAFNAAEPVRAATLARFAESFAPYGFDAGTLYPAYGLAEATLMVSGGRRGEGWHTRPVSRAALERGAIAAPADAGDVYDAVLCGRAVPETAIAIVDPQSSVHLGKDAIGEIWVRGAAVPAGYWNNSGATAATFESVLDGEGGWMRTGDLGFLDGDGNLAITGRRKDMLIVRGMNHYPQDIEQTVAACHPALAADGAVFQAGEDSSFIVVAQEVERQVRRDLPVEDIVGAVREAVSREHDLAVKDVVLLRPGALPKTTSGKVQRALTARLWREGALERLN